MLCFGTEDRQTGKNSVVASTAILPFVSFPGNEIKDLYVHESEEKKEEALPPPPKKNELPKPKPASSMHTGNNANTNAARAPRPPGPAAGTGEHLLKLKERTTGSSAMESPVGEFDFASALTSFKKDEVLAEVAQENTILAGTYIKDNFFDTLSSSVDPENARKDRMTSNEERVLNQDTFGAIALQQQNYRRGRGGQGGGRHYGGGRGHHGGGGGRGGRGGYRHHGGGGGYQNRGGGYRRGGRGRGGGGGREES